MSFFIETNFLISNIFSYFQKYFQMQFSGRLFSIGLKAITVINMK